MKKILPYTSNRWFLFTAITLAFIYFVPLVRLVPLNQHQQKLSEQAFNADKFVEEFWLNTLVKSEEHAVKLSQLVESALEDPENTVKTYGQKLGLAQTSSYWVSGLGAVVDTQDDTITISIQDNPQLKISIEIGPVFGNTIRDGSGFLSIENFANTQEFNAVSEEINKRVENRVHPIVKQNASLGTQVKFIGALEISDSELKSLENKVFSVVPVVFEIL